MTGDEVVAVFERHGHTVRGHGPWRTRCPVHDGRSNDSLSIADGDRGVVVYCHAEPGCGAEAILATVGLQLTDLFYEPPRAQRSVTTDVATTFPSERAETSSSSSSSSFQRGEGESEVDWLLRLWKAGRRKPVGVTLPRFPSTAKASDRKVAQFYCVVRGLRLTEDWDDDVPFAVDWVAKHTGLGSGSVSRSLGRLHDWDVIVWTGCFCQPGRPRTRLYRPGPFETFSVDVERVRVEPEVELARRGAVALAGVPAAPGGLAAPGDAANNGGNASVGHTANPTLPSGCEIVAAGEGHGLVWEYAGFDEVPGVTLNDVLVAAEAGS